MPTAPAAAAVTAFPDGLLHTVLDMLPMAFQLLRPLYAPDGRRVIDFHLGYLNPAGQQLLGLPEREARSMLARFPYTESSGIFDFYRRVFETGEEGHYETNYQADSLDSYFRFVARRSGPLLAVTFTAHVNRERASAEEDLRRSHARERATRAEAEAQRARLEQLLMAAPAAICILVGPEQVFELANPVYQQLVANRPLLGRPLREALPEIVGQAVDGLLRQVYATGTTHKEPGLLVPVAGPGGALENRYFNFVFQARRDEINRVDGVLVFAFEVTEQVQARQQAERLNQELEARVAERTHAATHARAEAEQQRQRLERFFQQAPAAICVLDGPELVYELVNPGYQRLFPGRTLLGRPILEALPEIVGHPVYAAFRAVYNTGITSEEQNQLVAFTNPKTGVLEDRYFTFLLQARYAAPGRIDGVLVCAFEVTAQVQAQQRADALQAQVLASAQRLAQERENFHQIFKHTPAAICIQHGPEHRYDYFNPAYQQFFPDRELQGRPVAEALPETVPAGFVALLDEVYRTGDTYFGHELPLTLQQPDGSTREMYFTFTYQAYQENGQTVGISTFAYDVTEQVLARRQQEAQQRQMHALFEQAPVAIAVFRGPQYIIELANPAVCALWGRTSAQALGTPLFTLLPEAAGQGFEELLDGVMTTGEPYLAEERPSFIDRNGRRETVYWNFVYQPQRDPDGRITGITVVATEVSELLRTRRELANQQQLRAVLEQAPVAVGVFAGPEYIVEVCNPGLQAIWGRTAAQMLHQPLFTAMPEVRDQGFKRLLDEVVRTGLPYTAREVPAQVAHNGQPTTVHLNFVYHPLRDAQGTVAAVAAVATDVTEQVAARQHVQALNQQLLALNDKLYAANSALGQANDELGDANEELGDTNQQLTRTNVDLDTFVYTASHDLRAPITNIEGLLQALLEELPPAHQVGNVAYILGLMHDSVDRFKLTIDHLTAGARLQKERGQPELPIDVGNIIRDVLLDLAPLLAETGGRFDVDVRACPKLVFSEKNLRSVVYNLLSNALKYHHPGREPLVRVHSYFEGEYVVLEVQDNGLGMDISAERPLFGLFQRYHTHVEGSGVGLYMVKKMAENAGGRIAVQSQVGIGSTFSVYFKH